MLQTLILAALLGPPALEADRSRARSEQVETFNEHSRIRFYANAGKDLPEGSEVDVRWNVVSDQVEYAEIKKMPYTGDPASTLYCWAPPGEYVLFANVFVRTPDGERSVSGLKVKFRVLARGPPEPDNQPDPLPDPIQPGPARQITYVFEHESGIVPRPIQEALRKLRAKGIKATAIDQNQEDADGNIPDQYKVALDVVSSVPSLVVEDGRGNVDVVINPTESDLLKYLD